jgi:hypothetical protein
MKWHTFGLALVLAVALFTTACADLLSVEPLATDNKTTFDPALLGVWTDVDGSNSVLIYVGEGEKHSYDILWIDTKDQETTRLEARLVDISGQRILDLTDKSNGVFSVRGHALACINTLENGLQLQFLDSKWLQEKVQQSKLLAHSQLEGHPLITGTTAQLQDFVAQFGLNEQARSQPISLRRLK